jgi:DNA-binding IclR family transcriptional regulator
MSSRETMPRNQSLVRGVALLRALAEHPAGMSVPALAAVTELPRTTVARLLATLQMLGAVERQGGRTWTLGPEVARIGRLADPFQQLRARSHTALAALAAELGESAMITVLYDTWEAETILQADAPTLVGATSWLGRAVGGVEHAAAGGKLALSELGDDELRTVTGRRLRRLTPATITDLGQLRRELQLVRDRGWAATVDELEIGLTAVAAPLRDPVAAASAGARSVTLTLSGLSARIPAARVPEIAARLVAVARTLSRPGGDGGDGAAA